MITLTSSDYTDVAAASIQGATELLHGVLPYGHITLALHGDTYPLLNYILYIARGVVATREQRVQRPDRLAGGRDGRKPAGRRGAVPDRRQPGARHGRRGAARRAPAAHDARVVRLPARTAGGLRRLERSAAGGVPGVDVALRTRTATALLLLAVGAWVKLVPLVLVAIWVPYRRRELARSWIAPVALSAALAGVLVVARRPGGHHGDGAGR